MVHYRRKAILVIGLVLAILISAFGLPFGNFGLDSRISAAYIGYPYLGQVIFLDSKPTPIYTGPGGVPTEWILPPDADGNGFDSYVVTTCEYVGSALWLGLFVGDEEGVGWVPFLAISYINPDYPFDPAICPA